MAPPRSEMKNWICTVLAGLLGAPMIILMLQSAWEVAQRPIGNQMPGYGGALCGMMLGFPWFFVALAAVRFNNRNMISWLTLVAPPVIVVAGHLAITAFVTR